MRQDLVKCKQNRIGKIIYNKYNSKMEIIEYNNAQDIVILFVDYNYTIKSRYQDFCNKSVKSPYCKSVCGIGYIGEGKYKSCNTENKETVQYKYWKSMLKRCYDTKTFKLFPTYIGCTVCEEWLNFQNFAKWFDENFYKINDETMCLDKDILVKGNKVYAPEYCIFVPQRINTLFIKCDKARGDLPIGVYYDKQTNKFKSQCSIIDTNNIKKRKSLGRFNTSKEAFNAYKEFKEKYIKQIAQEYKNKIPEKLYNAMINWKVEITD